jgi:hypothetical protein
MAEDFEAKLSRLARQTERLGPGPGFTERVLVALERDRPPSFGAGVVRFGRAALAIAALSAVVGVTVGLVSERTADEAVAATFGAEDLDW